MIVLFWRNFIRFFTDENRTNEIKLAQKESFTCFFFPHKTKYISKYDFVEHDKQKCFEVNVRKSLIR